jgi:aminoglycoside/choline kinase family phosphotransferase
VRDLVRFQTEAADALDTSLCYEGTHFDEAAWRRDQQLFLDHMAPMLPEAPIPAEALEQDFSRHRELLARWPGRHFLYRDFQPRNIMLTPDGMRYLDYQAGRLGHPAWDIAALTQSASSELEADEAAELRRLHARLLDEAGEVAEGEMEEAWPAYGLLRSLQSLGAHGRAARREVAGALDRAAVPLRQGLALIETHRELSGLHRLRDLLRALMQQVQAAEGQTEREEG